MYEWYNDYHIYFSETIEAKNIKTFSFFGRTKVTGGME